MNSVHIGIPLKGKGKASEGGKGKGELGLTFTRGGLAPPNLRYKVMSISWMLCTLAHEVDARTPQQALACITQNELDALHPCSLAGCSAPFGSSDRSGQLGSPHPDRALTNNGCEHARLLQMLNVQQGDGQGLMLSGGQR